MLNLEIREIKYRNLISKHLENFKERGFVLIDDQDMFCRFCEYSIKIDRKHIKGQIQSHLKSQKHQFNERNKLLNVNFLESNPENLNLNSNLINQNYLKNNQNPAINTQVQQVRNFNKNTLTIQDYLPNNEHTKSNSNENNNSINNWILDDVDDIENSQASSSKQIDNNLDDLHSSLDTNTNSKTSSNYLDSLDLRLFINHNNDNNDKGIFLNLF